MQVFITGILLGLSVAETPAGVRIIGKQILCRYPLAPFTAAPNERTLPDGRAFSVYSLQVEMLLQGFILSQNLQRHLVC